MFREKFIRKGLREMLCHLNSESRLRFITLRFALARLRVHEIYARKDKRGVHAIQSARDNERLPVDTFSWLHSISLHPLTNRHSQALVLFLLASTGVKKEIKRTKVNLLNANWNKRHLFPPEKLLRTWSEPREGKVIYRCFPPEQTYFGWFFKSKVSREIKRWASWLPLLRYVYCFSRVPGRSIKFKQSAARKYEIWGRKMLHDLEQIVRARWRRL